MELTNTETSTAGKIMAVSETMRAADSMHAAGKKRNVAVLFFLSSAFRHAKKGKVFVSLCYLSSNVYLTISFFHYIFSQMFPLDKVILVSAQQSEPCRLNTSSSGDAHDNFCRTLLHEPQVHHEKLCSIAANSADSDRRS